MQVTTHVAMQDGLHGLYGRNLTPKKYRGKAPAVRRPMTLFAKHCNCALTIRYTLLQKDKLVRARDREYRSLVCMEGCMAAQTGQAAFEWLHVRLERLGLCVGMGFVRLLTVLV